MNRERKWIGGGEVGQKTGTLSHGAHYHHQHGQSLMWTYARWVAGGREIVCYQESVCVFVCVCVGGGVEGGR